MAPKLKTTCCRSTPRCAGCPLRMAAHERAQGGQRSGLASLVEEIIVGSPPRVLPDAVSAALAELALARRRVPYHQG